MHEVEEKVKKVCDIAKQITCCFEGTISTCGVQNLNVEEAGKVTDMIKDLAEAEKEYWEACYYKSIVEAMEEAKESGEYSESMGYNHMHRANGKFATSGHGHYVAGYQPYMMDDRNMDYPMTGAHSMNMGYTDGRRTGDSYDHNRMMGNTMHGRAYDEYQDARRHYHESKSQDDKMHMEKKAMEHVNDSVMTLRDIWKDADPSVKKEVRTAISKLADEFEKP